MSRFQVINKIFNKRRGTVCLKYTIRSVDGVLLGPDVVMHIYGTFLPARDKNHSV